MQLNAKIKAQQIDAFCFTSGTIPRQKYLKIYEKFKNLIQSAHCISAPPNNSLQKLVLDY